MVLGRPHVLNANQYPPDQFRECAKRDQEILDSFFDEYERRRRNEASRAEAIANNPATVVAHVVYATG